MATTLGITLNKVRTSHTGRLSIEKRQYDKFCAEFNDKTFGTQRLGQAFYDYFKLGRMTNQDQLSNLYAKDGEAAKAAILAIFDLT